MFTYKINFAQFSERILSTQIKLCTTGFLYTGACLNDIFNKMFNVSKVQCSCFRSVHIFIVTDVGIIKYGVIIQNQKERSMIAQGSCKIYNVIGSGVIQLI